MARQKARVCEKLEEDPRGPLRWKEAGYSSYGMGFLLTPYRVHTIVHHGGNIDGFSALVTFMPQDKVGMVILTNMNGSATCDGAKETERSRTRMPRTS